MTDWALTIDFDPDPHYSKLHFILKIRQIQYAFYWLNILSSKKKL